jgi:multidrug efflux pump subunit AcrA (membrane-fusion protein)
MAKKHARIILIGSLLLVPAIPIGLGIFHISETSFAEIGERHEQLLHPVGEEEHLDHESNVEESGNVHPEDEEHDEDAHREPSGEHVGHTDHDEHDENVVSLSEEQKRRIGLRIAEAAPGSLENHHRFPGEIVLNEDRLAHIVPRAPGIVRAVEKSVGDSVTSGEIMAWIESAELGEVKVDYLAKLSELGCCRIDLVRAEEIHDNTVKFLEILESEPSLETLRKTNSTAVGENRSKLVSAYAEYVFAKSAYEREKLLHDREIGRKEDFLLAESALKKAEAEYTAALDNVGFQIQRDLLEAKQDRRVREIELAGAERRLHVLGLTEEDIEHLALLAQTESSEPPGHEEECSDPNCTACKSKASERSSPGLGTGVHEDHIDPHRMLGWYPLRAPFDGTVIDKHITLGEKLGDDDVPFTIADLGTVWVDIRVYQRDLPFVHQGQEVTLLAGPGGREQKGTVSFVSPIVDHQTRTALARIVLPNPDGAWRPGMFVDARISTQESHVPVVVPKSALQMMGEETVVFVETEQGLEARNITVGASDPNRVEVASGLEPGERYVVEGAFELKAMLVVSGMGSHAGHGH